MSVAGAFGSPCAGDVLAKERRRSRRWRYPKSTGTARRKTQPSPERITGRFVAHHPDVSQIRGPSRSRDITLQANPSHKLRLNFTYSIRAGFIRPDS